MAFHREDSVTDEERDAVQSLVSAALRVVRAPLTGVDLYSPMARAIFNLTLQLAAAGFIRIEEAQVMGGDMPQDVIDAECPARTKP
jgi:hypothetical protein